jgi:hypothetical protein
MNNSLNSMDGSNPQWVFIPGRECTESEIAEHVAKGGKLSDDGKLYITGGLRKEGE